MMFIGYSWIGLFIAAVLITGSLFCRWWLSDVPKPGIRFPGSDIFRKSNRGFIASMASFPRYFLWGAFFLLMIALVDPHFYIEETKEQIDQKMPREGVALYLTLDRSGSMQERVGGQRGLSKLNFLKQVAASFVKGRKTDMIGLLTFARGAEVLSPLTLDHEAILEELITLEPVKRRDQDGTAIGYALYKAVNLIAATRHYAEKLADEKLPSYAIKSAAVVLVTDGLQDPNPLDQDNPLRMIELQDAAKYAKEQGVKVYFINVEPRIAQDAFRAHRRVMERAAEETGGKFYLLSFPEQLQDVFADIDRIEKSVLPVQEKVSLRQRYLSFYPYCIVAAIILMWIAYVLETTILKRAP